MAPENEGGDQPNGRDHKVYDLADARRKQRTVRVDGARAGKPGRQGAAGGSGKGGKSAKLWSVGGVIQLALFLMLLWWTMSLCSGRGF